MDGIRLLCVDKSRAAQKRLSDAMEPVAEVLTVGSIAEARQAVAQRSPNVFVTEMELPDGDGLSLIRWIRAQPGHERTPIILWSAAMDNELAFHAMKAGANESHSKLTDLLELRQRVVQLAEVPSIQYVRRTLLQMTCFVWRAGGRHHEYSPDLNLHLEGTDPEEVRQRMQATLEREIRQKKNPEAYPADACVLKHVIKLDDGGGAA